jgi:hypothetical protein
MKVKNIWTYSEILTRLSVFHTRRVRISHEKCEFNTHDCNFHTQKCGLDTHECDLDTQTCYCNMLHVILKLTINVRLPITSGLDSD